MTHKRKNCSKKIKHHTLKTIYKAAGVTIVVIALLIIIGNIVKVKHDPYTPQTAAGSYQEKVMTVAEIERSQPMAFLSMEYQFHTNFFATKWRISGTILNKATVASYKDAVIRVNYLTKTGTVITSKEVTIYEVMHPTSATPFDFKVDNYKDVAKIDCDVISVVAN